MRKLALLLFCALYVIPTFSQGFNRPDTYNYNRAIEAVESKNYEEALDYLERELSENNKNGYAYLWIAYLHNSREEYGRALTDINLSIKYLPKKDSEYIASAYIGRSETYVGLGEIEKAIDDITTAIKYNPENEDFYERRAQLYFEQENYNLSDKDYKKKIELNEGSMMGYMGVGRNANKEERYEDAIKQFDYVLKLYLV